jgi:hypothetical protein
VVLPEDLHPSLPPSSLGSELSPVPGASAAPSAMSFMDGEPGASARESLLAEAEAAFASQADDGNREALEDEAAPQPPPVESQEATDDDTTGDDTTGDDTTGDEATDGEGEEAMAAQAAVVEPDAELAPATTDATMVEELETAPESLAYEDEAVGRTESATQIESTPPSTPPSPWESVKAPLRAAAAAPSALLLELASFDARKDEPLASEDEILEDATLELETADELVVPATADLATLSSLVDLSASKPPPRPPTKSVPPPPPGGARGRSMPPAPPPPGGRSVAQPPPVGGRSVPPPVRPNPSMPPPPRRD